MQNTPPLFSDFHLSKHIVIESKKARQANKYKINTNEYEVLPDRKWPAVILILFREAAATGERKRKKGL